jgi:hypothetical protein
VGDHHRHIALDLKGGSIGGSESLHHAASTAFCFNCEAALEEEMKLEKADVSVPQAARRNELRKTNDSPRVFFLIGMPLMAKPALRHSFKNTLKHQPSVG